MPKRPQAALAEARTRFVAALMGGVLTVQRGTPSNADSSSTASVVIAQGILRRLGTGLERSRLAGQTSGNKFEDICAGFLKETFLRMAHLRPGDWTIVRAGDGTGARVTITNFEQYQHLTALATLAKRDKELAAALRSDYAIRPDVVIVRSPETDERINQAESLVDLQVARHSPLRSINSTVGLLHASVSCKWTIRSDRVQNARSEALNLIRNRKGRVPHIVVVTGEPLPSRIAAIALGTGDVDCVYHFALNELLETLDEAGYEDAKELASIMVEGKRLRDITDLPLDLAT